MPNVIKCSLWWLWQSTLVWLLWTDLCYSQRSEIASAVDQKGSRHGEHSHRVYFLYSCSLMVAFQPSSSLQNSILDIKRILESSVRKNNAMYFHVVTSFDVFLHCECLFFYSRFSARVTELSKCLTQEWNNGKTSSGFLDPIRRITSSQ